MISQDDIDAFKEDFERVAEFVRRAEKGIPEDRWTDGAKGNALLAASCKRLLAYTSIQGQAMAELYDDLQKVGLSAMETHKDPMR